MNKYSEVSIKRLATCHWDLQIIMNKVLLEYDHSILCGRRGEKEQNEAFANGYSKLQYPNSKHNGNPSMAVDAAPYEKDHADFGKLQSVAFAFYVKGVADELLREGKISHKLRLGADWDSDKDVDDTTFWDAGHFELISNE